MSKAKKLCPFKKRITRTAKRGNRGELINELEEVFVSAKVHAVWLSGPGLARD